MDEGIPAESAALEGRLPSWTRALLDCLSPRGRTVFVLREGGGLTWAAIGERLFVSGARARQIHAVAARRITSAAGSGARLVAVVAAPAPPGRDERAGAHAPPAPPRATAALDVPLDALPLGVRAVNALEWAGVRRAGDLVGKTERDLLRLKNFGRQSLREVKNALGGIGLALASTPERTVRVDVLHARTHIADCLDLVERGSTVTLCRRGEPVAELRPPVRPG